MVAYMPTAVSNPGQSVASHVPAGCSPVRMAQGPKGNRLYITARNDNAVLALDTSLFLSNPASARVGSAGVGTAPVPVAVLDHGRLVLVGNSDRFVAPTSPQTFNVLNAREIENGGNPLRATFPTGAFPRTFRFSPDEMTLYLSDFGSNMLEVVDVLTLIILNDSAEQK